MPIECGTCPLARRPGCRQGNWIVLHVRRGGQLPACSNAVGKPPALETTRQLAMDPDQAAQEEDEVANGSV